MKQEGILNRFNKLPWIIIFAGIVFRVVQYLYNRSLYIDEARDTVVGILGRSFRDLFAPPPSIFTPSPPAGFFVVEKLAVLFWGDSEYVLRLFPLIIGIVSLFLFYYVAKQYTAKPFAALIALILFATLKPLIYYSSSVRPYSGDVAIALIIYLVALYIHSKKLTPARIFLFGVVGAIVVWFSNPSVFVLAGAWISLAIFSLKERNWKRIGGLGIAGIIWVLSFTVYYFLYLTNLTRSYKYFYLALKGEDAFMPFPPVSFADLKWFIVRFFHTFEETAGFYIPGIAALVFIIGCVSNFKDNRRPFIILISPAFLVLLASGLDMYPIRHRTVLFLVPAMVFLIGEGIEYIRDKTSEHSPLIWIVMAGLLLFHPLMSAGYHLIKPILREEIKPVMQYVKDHWQDGDVLYIHYRAHPAFTYYAKKYGFDKDDYIVGVYAGDRYDIWAFSVDYLKVYTDDLDKLRGRKRVWVLFVHTPLLKKGINEEVFFLYYLNTIGKQIDSFKSVGSSVYLYDLSIKKPLSSPRKTEMQRPLHWNF